MWHYDPQATRLQPDVTRGDARLARLHPSSHLQVPPPPTPKVRRLAARIRGLCRRQCGTASLCGFYVGCCLHGARSLAVNRGLQRSTTSSGTTCTLRTRGDNLCTCTVISPVSRRPPSARSAAASAATCSVCSSMRLLDPLLRGDFVSGRDCVQLPSHGQLRKKSARCGYQ